MNSLEQNPTPQPSQARFELSRQVDTQVAVDIVKDISDVYKEGVIHTDQYTGELVAGIDVTDSKVGDRAISVYRGESRKGRPAIVTIERHQDSDRVDVHEIKPGVPFHDRDKDFMLLVTKDLGRLILSKSQNPRARSVNLTANIYPGAEPFERTY